MECTSFEGGGGVGGGVGNVYGETMFHGDIG